MSEKEERIYPGQLLKEARKKTRRRYKRLSSELGIPEKYLEALEENNFSIMAGPTYVKGYLRAYAKKLDLDPETVIAAFDRYLKDQRRLEKKGIKKEQKNETKKKVSYIYALIFFLIASITLLIAFIPERNNDSEKKEDRSFSETEIQNLNDIPPILNTKPALSIELEQDTSQNIPDLNIQEEVIALEITDDVKDETNKLSIETINTIEMNFSGDCWIELMDKNGIIEYRLAKAGTSMFFEGLGPFKLLIGNSKRVELFYNDVKVSLASTTNVKTNVSCLVLPEGRCSEFTLSN
ncbi:MAG: membrane protein [Gammaproteobacteria bacterium]|mgnify:FL=1|nr:MAG: membrane protein [Gammaproteobacteria bacterium]|tara:strand:- start:5605 stop:6486 length:882 start_codon:yes stop_codon:yes gene_type:complete